MIGFIITGHGNFASGLYSACKILIGEHENIEVIDYKNEDNILILDNKINTAVSNLYEKCEKIIIFSDILNGDPFNRSMIRAIRESDKFYIFTGVNLPILTETIIQSQYYNDDCNNLIRNMKELFPYTFIEGISKLRDEMKLYEII